MKTSITAVNSGSWISDIKFEDMTDDLIQYVGQKVFDEGKDALDTCMTCASKDDKKTGYFMITAEKPL